MNVKFRYRLEAEGRETTWYWFRDAAIIEATRWETSKVTDEETNIVLIERKDGECISTNFRQ